jgi:type I restriction enzyme S subunit
MIKEIKLIIPSLPEQSAIATILSDLDSKIELNRQMNATLEAIGQGLFKHWFVDFEFPNEKGKPCKSNGGEMVDSELGEIPKGWKVGNFEEIIDITSGKRPNEKLETKNNEYSIPLVGASSVMGFVKESLYDEPIIIIGRVGTHGIVQRILSPSFPSDNTLVIKSKYYGYSYQTLKMINYESLNVGTTQPLITQSSIKNMKIIIPIEKLLDEYESVVSKIFIKIDDNNKENEILGLIRDSLLPRLMSGKISVGSAA